MQLSNTPSKLVRPFADAGGRSTIPVASQIGVTAGAASLTDGFPPLTRTPVAAGGVPPSGLDMNGILYEMSAAIRWANAGGGYAFDGAFAADTNVGGYPKGARVMRADGQGYWFNTVDGNEVDPEASGAAAAGWVPDFQAGATAVTMTSASVTLTPEQYGKPRIIITGALTANLNLIFPAIVGEWVVINGATGGYSITAKTAAGVGVGVPQGAACRVTGDGGGVLGQDIPFLQTGAGAIPRAGQEKLREVSSIFDAGAVGTGQVDESALFAGVKAAAIFARFLFRDVWMYCFPNVGAKLWKLTFGTQDQAAVLSVAAGTKSESTTDVLGFSTDSDMSAYSARDSVAVFAKNEAQPTLLTTSNTLFTATSVQSADFASVMGDIKLGMLLDTAESPKKSGRITAINAATNTVSVSAWYIVDGSRATATPANGVTVYLNPVTKVWAHNANITIPPAAHADAACGFELGIGITKPGVGGSVWGYDCVTLYGNAPSAHFISRGAKGYGFLDQGGGQYSFHGATPSEVTFLSRQDGSLSGTRAGFYSTRADGATLGAKSGYVSDRDIIGFSAQDTSSYGYRHLVGGALKFCTNSEGSISGSYLAFGGISTSTSVSLDSVVVAVTGSGITVTLPAPNTCTEKVYFIMALANFTLASEGGGAITNTTGTAISAVAAGQRFMLVSDGTSWLTVLKV